MTPEGISASPEIRFDVEELKDLYENAPCGYLSLEPGGRISRVNTSFLTWTDYGSEDLLGRRFQDLLNMAGKMFFETHFAPMLRLQGFFNEVALDVVARDGSLIPVLVNAVELRDSEENPTFIRITIFNATERRRYERELLTTRNALTEANRTLTERNDELRAFYEALPVGIFRTDASGRIAQASQRFCGLMGIIDAADWRSCFADEDDPPPTAQKIEQALRNAQPFESRFRVAGGARHIEMKAVPLFVSEGDGSGFVGVVEDVTEQVRAEAQARQIERDASVLQLTGGLAHNLNNILMVVMGNVEELKDKSADRPELAPLLDSSLVATERAASLVSRLLVYSGYSTSKRETLEIDAYLAEIAKDLSVRHETQYQLICDLRAPGMMVEIEAGTFREMIDELFANAVAAMPEGGQIELSTRSKREQVSNDQRTVVVSVSDEGIGMDEETLAKAHEPFFTMREVGEGIGLGLSLVDGVTRITGGELRLLSKPGSGTTVEMHLPATN